MDTLVTQIVIAGTSAAIFTYFMIELLIKPWLNVRYHDSWWRELATNGFALLFSLVAAIGLMFILFGLNTYELILETVFIGIIAASVATYGHEVVINFSNRKTKELTE